MTTIFGSDWSDFDYNRGARAANVARAAGEGIKFFTAKISEGTKTVHTRCGYFLKAAVASNIPFVGAYVVTRSPGNNGNGSVSAQVDFAIQTLNNQFPEWKTYPGFFWQVDLEPWEYDKVQPKYGIEMCKILEQRTGKRAVLYAPRWAYGETIPLGYPLWASNYGGSGASRNFKVQYEAAGGDSHPGWAKYSGQVPAILQFSSDGIAGGNAGDCNAYRGTVEAFGKMIGVNVTTPPAPTPKPPSFIKIKRHPGVDIGPTGLKIVDLVERWYPKAHELSITSAYRVREADGGTWSHHNGQIYNGSPTAAVDFAGLTVGKPREMRDFAKWWEDNFKDLTVELIHTTPYSDDNGFYIRNGVRYNYGAATNAAHANHVHLAMSASGCQKAHERAATKWGSAPPASTPVQPSPAPSAVYHKVVSGDTLYEIAATYGTTVPAIVNLNPDITDSDRISIGQRVRVK